MASIRSLLICLAAMALCVGAHAADAKDKAKKPATPEQVVALRITSSPDFVPFFSLAATVPKTKLVAGVVSADIGLDIADAALRAEVQKNSPRFRAALRDALAQYLFAYYRPGRPPDLTLLTKMMQSSVDAAAGKPGAKLYLVSVLVQLN
jgi:flagellar basal body-associated protein FliL